MLPFFGILKHDRSFMLSEDAFTFPVVSVVDSEHFLVLTELNQFFLVNAIRFDACVQLTTYMYELTSNTIIFE